jgi:hypothetical protein
LAKRSPVTIEQACNLLFGVARAADVPSREHWRRPRKPLAIDTWIATKKKPGRGVRLLTQEKLEGQKSVFGPVVCPHYTARQYLIRAVGAGQKAYAAQRGIHPIDAASMSDEASQKDDGPTSKQRVDTLAAELTEIVFRLERLIGRDPIPRRRLKAIPGALSWPRDFVLSRIDPRTGMIDLEDEAGRAAELYVAVNSFKKAGRPLIHEAQSLQRLLEREKNGVRRTGRALGLWDRSFIAELADLFLILTGADPVRAKAFFDFVSAAYVSIGREADRSHQIKIMRSPEIIESKSSALRLDDGRVYSHKKSKSRASS